MVHFLLRGFNYEKLGIVKTVAFLLLVAATIEIIGFSRSHSLTQVALATFFIMLSSNLFLHYSITTLAKKAVLKRKKQQDYYLRIMIPLFISMIGILLAVVVLYNTANQKLAVINSTAMIVYSFASILVFSFSVSQLVNNSDKVSYNLAFFAKLILLFTPSILTFITSLNYYQMDLLSIEKLTTFVISFYIMAYAYQTLKMACRYLLAGSPQKLDLIQLNTDLLSFEDVIAIQYLQAWSIATNLFGVKCKIELHKNNVHAQDTIDNLTDYILQRYDIEHISFEVINQPKRDQIDL